MIYFKPGDMFGYQNFAEQNGQFMTAKWEFDIFADTNGFLAFMPFGEVRYEMRKNPLGVCKLMEISANYAYETTYFNLTGELPNPAIEFVP